MSPDTSLSASSHRKPLRVVLAPAWRQRKARRQLERNARRMAEIFADHAVLLAALDIRPGEAPRPHPTRRRTGEPLTGREREVAELVSLGLANREIARRLAMSQRTAESHVERILNKLGFANRVQVAAWVSAGGLLRMPVRGRSQSRKSPNGARSALADLRRTQAL